MELTHLSASTVNTFNDCPYKLYRSKQEGRKAVSDNDSLEFGTLIHKVLEAYHTSSLFDKRTLLDIYKEEWEKCWVNDYTRFNDGLTMLKNYMSTEYYARKPLMVEKDFTLEIDGLDIPIRGFIDRIDDLGFGMFEDMYEIVDYKTSFKNKTPWEMDDDLQLSMYDLAFRQLLKNEGKNEPKELKLTLAMLRHQPISTERTDEQRKALIDYLNMTYKKILACTEPEQRINKFCAWCQFAAECDKFKNLCEQADGSPLFVTNPEEAYKQLSRVKVQIRNLEKQKEGLENFFINTASSLNKEEVEVGENSVSVKYTRYVNYDVDHLRSLFGVDTINRLSSVSKTAIDKLAKEMGISYGALSKGAKVVSARKATVRI